ncbi:MAG: glycoside hydrolase family 3 protein [Lachnospiraceae bacterium]|nr:glycoside hydrolase family 3 protein [Lachnospiraceae bacterium]
MRKINLLPAKKIASAGMVFVLAASMLSGCEKKDGSKAEKDPYAKAVFRDAKASTEDRVKDLMSKMDINDKIAQMIMAERNVDGGGAAYAMVKQYGLGAMLSGGGSAPTSGNNPENWSEEINNYKKAASESKFGIPILYGVDSVHGNSNVYGTTIFPHQIGLGATGDAELVEKIGTVTASETRGIGSNYAFSPVLGVAYDEHWGRFYECFGENTDLVTELGTAYVNGLQGRKDSDDFLSQNHLLCSIKHFVGEGQVKNGYNQGNVEMDAKEWDDKLKNDIIKPYVSAIEAGAQTLMVSYNSINGVNCHENKELITDYLKGELGFKGIVISDYDGVEHCKGAEYKVQLAECVNAGVDMLMEPLDWQNCYYTMINLVNDGTVSEDRINDAVSRILTVKFDAGLFEEKINSDIEKEQLKQIGSEEHRTLARQAVSESLTLLKNEKMSDDKTAIQTLAAANKIAVMGEAADDIGTQCGGWTISWTGSKGKTTEGTTILEGFKQVASDKEFEYVDSADKISADTQAVVVVAGEDPYSETQGDSTGFGLFLDEEGTTLINEAKAKVGDNVPVIVILVTGRPLTLRDSYDNIDALMSAWLPGSECAGIADVLFGEKEFTGTSPVTWPVTAFDISNKLVDDSVVLFKYGTGLKKDGSSIK